ncbi:MAG: DUF2267 domain-containing protein [Caulobacterales bacterium]|jgi:uncharacterized protein (DUF2267 family)
MATLQSNLLISFDESEGWVDDLAERLRPCSRQQAGEALTAMLHAVRDRLKMSAALALSVQLPMTLRGVFLEGWRPKRRPSMERSAQSFAAKLARRLPSGLPHGATKVACATFEVIAARIGAVEARKFCGQLPEPLRALWPQPTA